MSGYAGGCRCGKCRPAWAAYIRNRRRRAGARSREEYFAERRIEREAKQAKADAEKPQIDFPEKTEMETIMLTRLGKRLLDAARMREGKTKGDVVEKLLRSRLPHELLAEVDEQRH